jgi:hypothetical protein
LFQVQLGVWQAQGQAVLGRPVLPVSLRWAGRDRLLRGLLANRLALSRLFRLFVEASGLLAAPINLSLEAKKKKKKKKKKKRPQP